jgi:hypothetical protein
MLCALAARGGFNAIAVSILVGSVSTHKAAGGEMPFRMQNGKQATGIPFELNSNKIFIRVRIDEGEPSWFILDSGCPVTAIEMTEARKLRLPIGNLRQISGAGEGRTSMGTTKIKSLGLPGLDLFPTLVWALAVNEPVAPFEGRRIDGLLGVDFLERFVIRIDYLNRKLDVVLPGSSTLLIRESVCLWRRSEATIRSKESSGSQTAGPLKGGSLWTSVFAYPCSLPLHSSTAIT